VAGVAAGGDHRSPRALFDVTASDPLALAGPAAMFGIISLAVCLVPAIRAQRMNVVEALRQE